MSDDTTQSQAPLRRNLPMSHSKMLAIAAVAAMALFLAALAFTLSFDALRALAIEINVQPGRAWMAPVAIDVAQAAATAGYVIFRVSGKYNYARLYCMALAIVTVALSVIGNAYHSWQMADRNLARVAAGEDLGFIPQTPWIAAIIAAIFPLLWLALFHLFTMLLQVVLDERAQHRAVATDEDPVQHRVNVEDEASALGTPWDHETGTTTSVRRPELHPAEEAVAPLPVTKASERNDADGAGTAVAVAEDTLPRSDGATCNGYPQTRDGLLRFLEDSDSHETVKIVASMLVSEPQLKQIDVAQRLKIDKSTVSRRWRQFRDAAEAEGFSVPPLPTAEASERNRETERV
ncbi:DUF2637 domain-containing protein [Rhodococcus zopfii]|uniref:DUF2637 domain-containing protein n=2 Tax=Nocardiaceae TaxID=85025 RepID=UPI0009F8E29E|nr:DUF2637 domain-containing protein [Rhodococcus zopfii]